MDPNTTLDEMRELARRLSTGVGSPEDSARLATLVDALDGWIVRGGFLPTAWQAGKGNGYSPG